MNISKREFLKFSGAAAAFTLAVAPNIGFAAGKYFSDKTFANLKEPKLPYDKNDLAPFISEKTIDYHYSKHHLGYFKKLLKQMVNSKYSGMNLSDVILNSHEKDMGVFNNAAQLWNHSFYWHSMKKHGGNDIKDLKFLAQVNKDFGSQKNLEAEMMKAAAKHFGSGWAWLVLDESKTLKIITTSDAELPQTSNLLPILNIDLWEHAYYLDYQNDRKKYLNNFFKYLVNWKFANFNYIEASKLF